MSTYGTRARFDWDAACKTIERFETEYVGEQSVANLLQWFVKDNIGVMQDIIDEACEEAGKAWEEEHKDDIWQEGYDAGEQYGYEQGAEDIRDELESKYEDQLNGKYDEGYSRGFDDGYDHAMSELTEEEP